MPLGNPPPLLGYHWALVRCKGAPATVFHSRVDMQACLGSLQQYWERAGPEPSRTAPEEEPALVAMVRLLSRFAATQLGHAEASPGTLEGVMAVLRQVAGLTFARR